MSRRQSILAALRALPGVVLIPIQMPRPHLVETLDEAPAAPPPRPVKTVKGAFHGQGHAGAVS